MIYTYDMLQIAGAVFNQGSGAERRALKLAIKSFSAAVGTSGCLCDYVMGADMGRPNGLQSLAPLPRPSG
jgi:hypothetical protein